MSILTRGEAPTRPAAPPRQVEATWIDYNGHMNVAYYTLAFDQSLDVILDEGFGIGPGYVAETNHGPYVVQNHIHYLAELFKGEEFQVCLQLLDADTKRIHVFLEMWRCRDNALAATSEQLIVHVDLARRKTAPFPEDRRARIEALREAHSRLPRPQQVGAALAVRRTPQG